MKLRELSLEFASAEVQTSISSGNRRVPPPENSEQKVISFIYGGRGTAAATYQRASTIYPLFLGMKQAPELSQELQLCSKAVYMSIKDVYFKKLEHLVYPVSRLSR